MNTLGARRPKKGPANFEHIPRPGREAGGGPPLLNFEHGVQNVKKVHIPAAAGKNAGPPNVKKLRPGGSGAAARPLLNAARPLLNAAAAAGKRGAGKKKGSAGFSRASRFSRFSGLEGPETEIGGRGERGAGRGGRGGRGKTIVKIMINTRNSKGINTKILKKGHQNHKMWGRKVRKSRLFSL